MFIYFLIVELTSTSKIIFELIHRILFRNLISKMDGLPCHLRRFGTLKEPIT